MKNILNITILSSIILSCQSVSIQDPSGDLGRDLQQLLDYYQPRDHRVGLGILYYHPELGEYQAVSGYQTITLDQTIRTSSIFEIGSTSKLLLASLIMQLEAQKKLDLQTTVDSFFPEIPRGSSITIQDLLQHTSGIPDYLSHRDFLSTDENYHKDWTSDELIVMGLTAPSVDINSWNYSNTNYILLGAIVEEITGQPAEEVIRQEILEPLEMDSTFYRVTEEIRGSIARGYYADKRGRYWDSWAGLNPSVYSYAGGYVSNLEDIRKFLLAYHEGLLLSPASKQAMEEYIETPNPWNYGLGIFQLEYFNEKYIGHGGTTFGTRNFSLVAPETGEVLIVFTTLMDDDIYHLLEKAEGIISHYIPEPIQS